MNIFSSDKAPYVLALLISVVGWFFSNAVTETRKRVYLSYDTIVYEEGGNSYFELLLRNDSIDLPFENISVELRCPTAVLCLVNSHPNTNGAYVVSVANPPWDISVLPLGSPETQSVIPRIPAGASFRLRAGLSEMTIAPTIFYKLPADASIIPEISKGWSPYGFIFRNYLQILIGGGLFGVLVFAIWAWNTRLVQEPQDGKKQDVPAQARKRKVSPRKGAEVQQ